jgi:hypothetical protein
MSDGKSFGNLGVYVGTDWRLACHTYADSTPILAVNVGRVALTISPEERQATDSAVAFARELAKQAARFAAEVERLHAAQHTGPGICAEHGGAAEDTAA